MRFQLLKVVTAAAAVMACLMPGAVASSQSALVVAQAVSHETYSSNSLMGTLLDDPQAKAVLQKIIPDVVNGEQIDMARGMTLKQLQQYAPDKLTDDVLKKVDTELAKLNTPKS